MALAWDRGESYIRFVPARRPVEQDLRNRLEERIGVSHHLDRELGGGGMSRVFLATERALDRRVVIKVLAPEQAIGVSIRRFEREIQLAASLQQANIVPVLTAGEVDGLPFYTMPFVDGRSLRDRLRDGALPLAETIGILRDVARALAYAHDRGVVHRDIKPENILLSGEAAVVTDFGIAKAVQSARAGSPGHGPPVDATLTGMGLSLGTPAYMAPEQIAADPAIDHRADLYAFGCVAYELLTGEAPYAGRPAHAILAAHLGEAPVPLTERVAGVPSTLATLVARCLDKDPARRPASAREMLPVFDGSVPVAELAPRRTGARSWSVPVLRLAAGAIALAGVAALVWVWRAGRASVSIAVIPFLAPADSTDAYLADGLADGVATALGRIGGVRVVSRSLARRYRGLEQLDPAEVGRELSAAQVLQGTLHRSAGRLHLSAQLSDTRDNRETWSESFEWLETDAHRAPQEIVAAIAAALRGRMGVVTAEPALSSGGTNSAEAFDLHLRGKFLLERRGPGVRQAIENFEQAIRLDSGFAAPRASLALALELLPYFEDVDERALRPAAITAATFALARDSSLVDAHTALAMTQQHAYEWADADRWYRRAMAHDPEEADAHLQYGRFLFYTGRVSEAREQFSRARTLAPYSAVASGWLGHLMELTGDPDVGMIEVTRALEIDSTNPPVLVFAAQAHLVRGDTVAGRALAERLWRTVPQWRVPAALMLSELGDTTWAIGLLAGVESGQGVTARQTLAALLYLAVGDTTRFFAALERATAAGELWPTYYSLSERMFDPLRNSERFAAIIRSVGLDAATFTSPTGGRPR